MTGIMPFVAARTGRMLCRLALGAALLGQAEAGAAAAPATQGDAHPAKLSCPPAASASADEQGLPDLAAALAKGGTVTVLAIGGGIASGSGFLPQFGHALEGAVRGLHVTLAAKGGRGRLARDQLGLLRDGLRTSRAKLVLWETGTIDAVQGEPLEDFSAALSEGADAADAAGADLVLIEPQYSHFLEANANPGPYLSSMEALGAEHGTAVFRRYAIMQDWEDQGAIDLEHALPADRPAVAARLHGCLARELLRTILDEAGPAGSAKP